MKSAFKRFTLIALIALIAPHPSHAFLFKRPKEKPQAVLARVTVYWASGGRGSDRYTRQHKCSTGTRLRIGHCAVDPQRIPYGSNVIFPDGTSLAAVDTGSAVKNRKAARLSGRTPFERNAPVIDRFFETKQQALTWANTHPLFMAVRVIPPQQQSPARFAPNNKLYPVKRAIAVKSTPKIQRSLIPGPEYASIQLPKLVR